MTALFVRPIPFTASTSGNYPPSNLADDRPGLACNTGTVTASFSSQSVDTIVLVGQHSGTVTATGQSSKSAYTGSKAAGVSTKTIFHFAPTTLSSVTVTWSGWAQRLIIGKACVRPAINTDCEQTFVDNSIEYAANGFIFYDYIQPVPQWKVTTSWISYDDWNEDFYPMFALSGSSRGIFFVPYLEDEDRWQHQAIWGKISSGGKGKHIGYDMWHADMTITGIVP